MSAPTHGRRVVVTGIGMLTPVGNDVASTWENILAGKSGAATIDSFDVSDFSVQFSASVKDFDVTRYMSAKEARRVDIFVQYGMAAAIQAIEDSGLEVSKPTHRVRASLSVRASAASSRSRKRTTRLPTAARARFRPSSFPAA